MHRICVINVSYAALTVIAALALCGHIKTAQQRTIIQQYSAAAPPSPSSLYQM